MAGGVDGDDPEPHGDEPGQGLCVEEPFDRKSVDHDERHALAGDGHAHLVAVGERDLVPGETGRLDGAGRERFVEDRTLDRLDDLAHA